MAPAGPSMVDQLPNINFGFDELRDRMAKFTTKFDAYIEQGRKRVLEERNQFRMDVAELQGMCFCRAMFPAVFANQRMRRGPAHEEKGH